MFAFFGEQIAHVVRKTRQTEQARLLIQQGIDLVERHSLFMRKKLDDRRIEVAATRPHDKSFERRQSHGSIYAFPVFYCSNGRTVPQMACHNFEILDRAAQYICAALCNISM